MSLPYDVCRCLGEELEYVCPERDTCVRYLATKQGSDGERVPYAHVLRRIDAVVCDYKIEE